MSTSGKSRLSTRSFNLLLYSMRSVNIFLRALVEERSWQRLPLVRFTRRRTRHTRPIWNHYTFQTLLVAMRWSLALDTYFELLSPMIKEKLSNNTTKQLHPPLVQSLNSLFCAHYIVVACEGV